jgi:hypothetical protein
MTMRIGTLIQKSSPAQEGKSNSAMEAQSTNQARSRKIHRVAVSLQALTSRSMIQISSPRQSITVSIRSGSQRDLKFHGTRGACRDPGTIHASKCCFPDMRTSIPSFLSNQPCPINPRFSRRRTRGRPLERRRPATQDWRHGAAELVRHPYCAGPLEKPHPPRRAA